MSDVFYLSIYHCTSAHHQYSTCLITCAQSLYSIINFQLTLSAFITNSPAQIEMITSPSALKTLKQVRTMKQLFGLPYLPVIFQKFHQIKSIAITYSFELLLSSFIPPPECRLSIFQVSVALFAEIRHSGLNGTLNKGHLHK